MGAHVLAQCVSYHEPLKMSDKWIEVAPDDIIWDNIDDVRRSEVREVGSDTMVDQHRERMKSGHVMFSRGY